MKKFFTTSLFFLLMLSPLTITSLDFARTNAAPENDIHEIKIPDNTGLPDPGGKDPIITVLISVTKWILAMFLVLAIISFVITGFQFMFSFGGSIDNAKKNFMYSIIAVLVVGGALIIIKFISDALNASF